MATINPTHNCMASPCPICWPTAAAQPWGVYTIYPQTYFSVCNCGAFACAANPMGYPASHGPDCPMCPPQERWLKLRIRELEGRVAELTTQIRNTAPPADRLAEKSLP